MKKLLSVAMVIGALSGSADAVLMTGDIVIIGLQSDDPNDSFSWVPLVDVAAGEVVYFSDAGFNSGTGFFQGQIPSASTDEWLLRYIAPAGGITAGTVQTVVDGSSPANYSGPGTTSQFGARSLGGTIDFSLTPLGDELIAFQSTDDPSTAGFGQSNFTPLFQVDTGSFTRPLFTFDGGARSHTTDVHTGLTEGVNAVGLRDVANNDEFDNIRYTGPSSGDRDALLAALADSANWEGTNDAQSSSWTNFLGAGNNFTVTPVPEPTMFAFLGAAMLLTTGRRVRRPDA